MSKHDYVKKAKVSMPSVPMQGVNTVYYLAKFCFKEFYFLYESVSKLPDFLF